MHIGMCVMVKLYQRGGQLNMKKFLYCFVGLFILSACRRGCPQRKKLANTYYQLSLLESQEASKKEHLLIALQFVNKALAYYQDPAYEFHKSSLLMQLSRIADAQSSLKRGLASVKDPFLKAEMRNNYACLLAQTGEEACAMRIWQELASDKDYVTPEAAWFNQGRCYMRKNAFIEAKKCFQAAIAIDANYLDARCCLAHLALYHLGDSVLAQNEIRAVLFADPSFEQAKKLAQHITSTSTKANEIVALW